jgi:alkanesulfonate monooxygenase SsuD/methylene tetrahydromethanopterin reductase-like flavin-dependent oxidoreductase (luciferase family)
MQAIWTQDEASYDGDYVRFERAWSWPKPVQRPHPPVLVGGNGPTVLDRVLDFGDEWMPNRVGDLAALAALAGRVAELRRRAEDAGRGRIPVTIFGASSEPADLDRYAEMGVDRCLFSVPSAGADEVLPLLDQHAETVAGR